MRPSGSGPPPVHSLLLAVHRHLWLARAVQGLRRALWASAAVWVLVMGVHLAGLPLPAGTSLVLLAALWAAAVAWVASQRPAQATCAWWADRHLGGASAYTTLLEVLRGAPAAIGAAAAAKSVDVAPAAQPVSLAPAVHPFRVTPAADPFSNAPAAEPTSVTSAAEPTNVAPAAQWLQHWATQQAPASLQLLSNLKKTHNVWQPCARPLVAALLCAALASVVFLLHQPPPSSVGAAGPQPGGGETRPVADASTALARAPEAAPLVAELSKALRAQPPFERVGERAGDRTGDRPGAGTTPSTGAGNADGADRSDSNTARDEPAPVPPPGLGAAPPDPRALGPANAPSAAAQALAGAARPAVNPARGMPAGGDAAAAGRDTGREAGTSPDLRAQAGSSSALAGPLAVQLQALPSRAGVGGSRADGDRAAAYSSRRDAAGRATMLADGAALPLAPRPAPAAPPIATAALSMSATQSHYVQAWMQARAQRP